MTSNAFSLKKEGEKTEIIYHHLLRLELLGHVVLVCSTDESQGSGQRRSLPPTPWQYLLDSV